MERLLIVTASGPGYFTSRRGLWASTLEALQGGPFQGRRTCGAAFLREGPRRVVVPPFLQAQGLVRGWRWRWRCIRAAPSLAWWLDEDDDAIRAWLMEQTERGRLTWRWAARFEVTE